MLKRKNLKIVLVLACIMTLILPYTSTVLAVKLAQTDTVANLQVILIHKGGEESSGTLKEEYASYYDKEQYQYKIGDTKIFKIILEDDFDYENAMYCLDATKSFPGVTAQGNTSIEYKNVADLKDSSDSNVKSLHLVKSNSEDSTTWSANYKSLVWLIDNMYLSTQTPERKTEYLTNAFAETDEDVETVKALLTDDDIDVVQQWAIWYFTNRDTEKYNCQDLPAITITALNGTSGSYNDVLGPVYAKRQDYANELYKYLIKAATEAEDNNSTVTYPEIDTSLEATSELKDDYYAVGPFKTKSGTANSSTYEITLTDENGNKIERTDYKILIEGENEFTNKNVNEIFDTNYYIYLPTSNTNITSLKLNLSYSSVETKASLWKNSTTNDSGEDVYQPVVLITREKEPHNQSVKVNIDRKTADLALRKYIVKVNDKNQNRAPIVDVTSLKSGESKTAIYKHAKSMVEVSTGDTVVYEIRVYNEGEIAGTATSIIDALPIGLELADNSSINETYGWTKVSEGTNTVVYSTDYLKDTTIAAFDKQNGTELESAYVQIECKVKDGVSASTVLTNVAEIADDNISDRDSIPGNNSYTKTDIDSKNYTGDKDNKPDLTDSDYYYKGIEDDDDFEKVIIKGKAFDLALRKFIVKVNNEAPKTSREPIVDVSDLKNGKSTNAKYTHPKTALTVKKGDIVIYTLRVYNEGDLAGYAEEVADYLPEGLGFLVNHTVNVDNYWSIPEDSKTVKLNTIENGTKNLSLDNFTDVKDLNNVEVVVGKAKLTSTKLKSNESDTKNLIKAFDKNNGTKLDYKDIQVACIVLEDEVKNNNFKNIGEITKDSDENRKDVTDRDSTPDTVNPDNYPGDDKNQDDNDYELLVPEKEQEETKYFDLSLQKFITAVNDNEVKDRYPTITKNTDGTLRFNHSTEALAVCNNDLVTYTIRVYNEGDIAGYAKEVADDLPKGLLYVADNETNKKYEWKLYDNNGNVTEDVTQATVVKTNYLSKEKSEERKENCLIKPFDKTADVSNTNPDYRDLKIVFKVVESVVSSDESLKSSREIINTAEIYDDEDENGNPVDDKDSTPGNNKDGEDDQDKEKIYVKYFDLALQKDLVKIIITEDGKTREISVGATDSLQKVEIHRKKIDTTTVKFVYNITVKNEGEIAGYATEIKDYIPEGLEFIQEDNKQWSKVSDSVITTNALAETLLEPGKTGSVQVTLKWKNSDSNLGLKTNVAEISKDKNDSNTPDKDSVPDNKVYSEDDLDTAEVMLSISTGSRPVYIALTGTVLTILATGIILIKKYVLL